MKAFILLVIIFIIGCAHEHYQTKGPGAAITMEELINSD